MKKYILPLGLIIILGSIFVMQPAAYQTLKLKTFDTFIEPQEPSGYFTILNITEDDIANEGGYPLSRQTLAQIQINLLRKGATGVGWVIAFPQPDRFGGDNQFAQALSFSPSVLAMFEDDSENFPPTVGTVILGENKGGIRSQGVIQNIQILKENASQGIAVARTDADGLVRRLPLLMRTPDGFVPSYGAEVLKILAGSDTYIIKTNDNGIEEIRVKGLPPVKTDSYGRKWVSFVNTPQTDLKRMDVKDKFVFVGFTAKGIMPQIAVPNNKLLEPHKIQAALAESMLIENSPYIPDYAVAVEIGLFLVLGLFAWLLLHVLGVTLGITLFMVQMSLTAFLGVYFIKNGLLIDVTWSLISQFILGSTAFYVRFREQYKLRKQIKGQFGTYISPEYVDIIVKDPSLMVLGGETKELSYLFTDIVGFTPISEQYMKRGDPEGLVNLINRFLDEMTLLIINKKMTLDKFMGDCIMAFAGSPIPMQDHAITTVQTAIELELLCESLNKLMKEEGLDLPPLMFGTGCSTGQSVVGNTGSSVRMNYSVIGDAVNLGARLEAETRKQNTPILLPQQTYDQVKDKIPCAKIDQIKVKGKEELITIYAPLIEGKVRKLIK